VAETALLEVLGLRVQTAADADEAIETLRRRSPAAPDAPGPMLVSAQNTCDTIRVRFGDETRMTAC
jgi:CheY-like chemotaxis protein